jgi:hypothetical protein
VDGTTYLISAGHALEKSHWAIETSFTVENECKTVCIPVGGAWILKKITIGKSKPEEVDIAWAKVDFEAFRNAVMKDKKLKGKPFEYFLYEGSTEEVPNAEDPHIYAACNQGQIFSALGKTYLERNFSYEYEMEYKGSRNSDGLYVFSIPKHKGHEYYRGASGSPIIEPSGKIVAVFVGGCETDNELYGFPMRGLAQLIKISADADQRKPAEIKMQ